MIRLVRWRVRDWTTCFSACALPPIDEEQDNNCSTSTQMASQAMVFDPFGENRSREIDRKNSNRKKYEKQEKSSAENPNENIVISRDTDDGSSERRCPNFAEEEYIVFCFRDDGAIHMIKERRPPEASENEGDTTLLDKPGDEEEEEEDIVWPLDEIKEVNHIDAKDDNIGFPESIDSNQSDGSSTSSFAFPELRWEWMGSPVQMPKPEGIRLRKHKTRAVLLQCCRF